MKKKLISIIIACLSPCLYAQQSFINLSGSWKFAIDSLDKGTSEKWFSQNLDDEIILPGSMISNGKGNEVGLSTPWTGGIQDSSFFINPIYAKYRTPDNFKVPFWLQPIKYYKGVAWYQKEIEIPTEWKDKTIQLFLERCHWETRLWVDESEIGMCNSLNAPHLYDLSNLKPGKHTLTLCVDNRIKDINPGINSHSISDHTQGNWNGIVGKIQLEAKPLAYLSDVAVFPNIQGKNVTAKIQVKNTLKAKSAIVVVETENHKISKKVDLVNGLNNIEIELPLGSDIKLWDEFHPNIYTLKTTLSDTKNKIIDLCETDFGMREFKAENGKIMINGQQVFLRGTLDCAEFPKTGFPPTEKDEWIRIFNICKAYGLNHIRFHSWCPPEAAFSVADSIGLYLEIECGSWANQGATIGDGKPLDEYIYEESRRIVQSYGNHPSFCMMLYGNEPAGKGMNDYLAKFVSYWKEKDNRHIYSSGSGWPNLPVNDFLSDPKPRIQAWGDGLKSIINAESPRSDYDWSDYVSKYTQPIVSHEIGQWCVYPDFKEIAKYDGAYRARNFEIFRETLEERGLISLADSFLLASGKLQTLCYKADIEAALRTKDFGGFQLLGLYDFSGQGTALVGVLNAFWEEKGYVTAKEFSEFCNSTVPLVRLPKFIYENNETLTASVEVAHFSDKPLLNCIPEWNLANKAGETVGKGKLPQANISIGSCIKLGTISVPLSDIKKAEELKLTVSVGNYKNSWNVWVYPSEKEDVKDVKILTDLEEADVNYLKKGGIAILSIPKGKLSKAFGGDIEIGFSSIFWNTAWTNGQPPHTLGILCNPKHPALADFPTEYYSDYQWWDAMSHSSAINIGLLSNKIQPIVRVIDDWFTNRSLALLFEVKVGKGKLLVSSIDFTTDMNTRSEARQLLHSLKKYMDSSAFNPEVEIEDALLVKLYQ